MEFVDCHGHVWLNLYVLLYTVIVARVKHHSPYCHCAFELSFLLLWEELLHVVLFNVSI